MQKSPHTQTEHNVSPLQTDTDQEQSVEGLGHGDAELYANREGAQTGGNKAPLNIDLRGTQQVKVQNHPAHTGNLTTRTPESANQGITSHSASEESSRQHKVADEREDAQACVNDQRKPA